MNLKSYCKSYLAIALAAGLASACGGGEPPMPTIVIDAGQITSLEADAALLQVQDIAVDDSGQFWVLQRDQAPHVFIYSAEGELVDLFGEHGPARTQISLPYWLVKPHAESEAMGVWDVGNHKVMFYGSSGRLEEARQVDRSSRDVWGPIYEESYGRPLDMQRFGEGFLLLDHVEGLSRTIDYLRSQLIVLNRFGQKIDTLIDFKRHYADEIEALELEELLVPIPLWTTCESGELVLFDPFASRLHWYAPDGAEQASDTVPLRLQELRQEDIDRYLFHTFEHRWNLQTTRDLDTAVIERSIEDFMLNRFLEISTVEPYATGVMCGASRQLWLQEFVTGDNPLGYANSWLVHEPQEADLVRVEFPSTFRPLRISGNTILGVSTNAQGIQTGAWVPVPAVSTATLPGSAY
ncbi:MAG: hypothetical protein JSW51_10455 [Gemmatimonadota bacterium]|nr:MAG: hypothetical protein JSW51_10455 [Gemmatimonadota bacterium]